MREILCAKAHGLTLSPTFTRLNGDEFIRGPRRDLWNRSARIAAGAIPQASSRGSRTGSDLADCLDGAGALADRAKGRGDQSCPRAPLRDLCRVCFHLVFSLRITGFDWLRARQQCRHRGRTASFPNRLRTDPGVAYSSTGLLGSTRFRVGPQDRETADRIGTRGRTRMRGGGTWKWSSKSSKPGRVKPRRWLRRLSHFQRIDMAGL